MGERFNAGTTTGASSVGMSARGGKGEGEDEDDDDEDEYWDDD